MIATVTIPSITAGSRLFRVRKLAVHPVAPRAPAVSNPVMQRAEQRYPIDVERPTKINVFNREVRYLADALQANPDTIIGMIARVSRLAPKDQMPPSPRIAP